MNLFAHVALLSWPVIVVLIFNVLPPRKAVVGSFVIAWLFLPNVGYVIPGLPDYTKMTATVIGVLIGSMIFDQARFFAFRPRWFDIPIVAWCLGAFVTTIMNDLTAYNGLSLMIVELVNWGLPYFIGRLYLSDLDAMKELAEAIAIGGICYIPLCLLEMRLSPVLQYWVYNIGVREGMRYGGFRPMVFMSTGLMLGIWMANASVVSYALWSFGTIKSIRGISFGMLTLALVVTTFLCKSTGAIGLMLFAIVVLWITKRFKKPLALWVMVLIPPLYCTTRSFDLWSGQNIVEMAKATVGDERARSFEYRLEMEQLLVARAFERPIFGWGGFNRFQVTNETGRTITVPDGFWVIALGVQGFIGLTSMLALFVLPMILTLRRFPMATWSDPRVGPVVGLALMLSMTMIDFLSNAMIMPLYPLAIGGFLGHLTYRRISGHGEAKEALALASDLAGEGRVVEAGREFHRAIELASGGEDDDSQKVLAEALDGLGHSLLAEGRPEDAASAFREALVIRDGLAASIADDERFRDLAIARDGLSRALAESGRTAEAIQERQIALQIWEILEANHPRVAEYRGRRANTLNDLAWLLATDPGTSTRDPARAVALAEESVRISPDHDASWNTLGVARYRAGDWTGAIEALERSAAFSPGGVGTAFDHYFLAMAWCQLQHFDQAGEWLERGIAWGTRNRPGHLILDRFRSEAESLSRGQGNIEGH
jgi:tetratricopeptide (TPR) repeat protein